MKKSITALALSITVISGTVQAQNWVAPLITGVVAGVVIERAVGSATVYSRGYVPVQGLFGQPINGAYGAQPWDYNRMVICRDQVAGYDRAGQPVVQRICQ
jgi:hypothetical protein